MSNPEYESIEAFVQECMDDDRTEFTHEDLGELAYNLQRSRSKVRTDLEGYGLKLGNRAFVKRTRGFTTSSNDRWFGPGACNSHGGSGWEQITGFAGRKG